MVNLTHLDDPLFDGAEATKRDLIGYLEAVAARLVGQLRDRPLSVVRVRAGQQPFMQKNVPDYAPDWIRTVSLWAQSSSRQVRYALCDDEQTLIWFGNQRAVEYHPTLSLAQSPQRPGYLVLDIDPPPGSDFGRVVGAARLVRSALSGAGLAGAVKTSGSKGVHIYVPVDASAEDAAAATRALAARAAEDLPVQADLFRCHRVGRQGSKTHRASYGARCLRVRGFLESASAIMATTTRMTSAITRG